MSLSRQFFGTAPAHRKHRQSPVVMIDDKAWMQLHWTKQLELKPLRDQKRREYNRDGDYDTRIDNFDTDNEREEQ